MKNTIFYLLISIFISIGFAGCQQVEDKAANIPIVRTCEAENISATAATIYGEVESLNAIYCFYYFLISEDCTFPDDNCMKFYYEECEPDPNSRIRAELDELTSETTYYYVMCATDGISEVRSDVASFTTTTYGPAHIGDYYYSDGSWSQSRNTNKECIGVVFALSEEKYGEINPWIRGSYHGRIVDVNDIYAGEKYPWAKSNYEEDVVSIPNLLLLDGVHDSGELPYNGQPTTNETLPYGIEEWLPYTGDYALTDYNGYNYRNVSSDYSTAIFLATSSDGSSVVVDWYLPALGELARLGMACAAGLIPKEGRLASFAYGYWSSTECNSNSAWVYRPWAGKYHNHIVEPCSKQEFCGIRRVACF